MTIFQTECFLAVAEHLNFSKAAQQVNISQPAITRQIQSLEGELGTKLFNRSTRSVSLTAEGKALIAHAHIIAGTSQRILKRFQKQDKEKIIDFHIGYSSSSHAELMKNALEKLKDAYPCVHPRQKEKSSLIYRELKKLPYICVCRRDCPVAELGLVIAMDLRPYPMIVYDPGTMPQDVIAGQWEWAEEKNPPGLRPL